MFTPSDAVQRIVAHSQRPSARPGPDVISLASGDPDFETPEHIRRALAEAIEAGHTHYGHFQGDAELRNALSDRIGHSFSANDVVITHGASGALAATILATVNPGDRVLLPEPTYSLYSDLIRLAAAEPVYIRQLDDFHLDLDALRGAAMGAKMLILCHPCNPTGVVYRREELEAVSNLAAEHDLLVLADEAYDHIVYDGVDFTSTLEIDELRDRLIYCQTFSKTYAMTGWRLGYIAAPTAIATAIATVHRSLNGPMNTALQRAALAAVTVQSDWPERMLAEYEARRELVYELLAGVPGIETRPPEGTFYAFVRYASDISSLEVAAAALERGVAVRAGSEYGPSGEGHIRIAFSTDRYRLREGMLQLRSLLLSLADQ